MSSFTHSTSLSTGKYFVLVSRIVKSGTGDNNFDNGKGHFGPTDRNGPFHLMNQPKFPDFWVEWKAPLASFYFPVSFHYGNNGCVKFIRCPIWLHSVLSNANLIGLL